MEKNDIEYLEKVQANQKLQDVLKYSRDNHIPTMLTNTGKLLYKYVKKLQPKSILEIGTAIGYSGIVMLTATENKSHLVTVEKDENRVKMAKDNFFECNLQENVTVVQGDASQVVNDIYSQLVNNDINLLVENQQNNTIDTKSQSSSTIDHNENKSQNDGLIDFNENKSQKFDFIFLDGSKSQYIKQIDMLLGLLNDNGVIFIDDALYMYDVYKEGDVPHKHRAMIKNLREFVKKILTLDNIDKRVFNYDEGIIVLSKR